MKKFRIKLFAAVITAALVVVNIALISTTPQGQTIWQTLKGSTRVTYDGRKTNELGFELVDCINRQTLIARLREGVGITELKAYGSPWGSSEFHVQGMIGWHVSWLAILAPEVMPLTVYETYGPSSGSMWAREVPPKIVTAFQKCGVVWGGNWPHDLSPSKVATPRKPRPKVSEIPSGEDLLPPPL